MTCLSCNCFSVSARVLNNFTCRISHAEDITQSATRSNPPKTQFDCCERKSWLGKLERESFIRIGEPLYKVTMNAPTTDTTVPMDFAMLLSLHSSFSILKETIWINFELYEAVNSSFQRVLLSVRCCHNSVQHMLPELSDLKHQFLERAKKLMQ